MLKELLLPEQVCFFSNWRCSCFKHFRRLLWEWCISWGKFL